LFFPIVHEFNIVIQRFLRNIYFNLIKLSILLLRLGTMASKNKQHFSNVNQRERKLVS